MENNKPLRDEFVPASEQKAQNKNVKKTKKKSDKPNIFSRIGAKCKDIFSELKKVSWPSFSKVVKQTGVVIVVVLAFLVVITAFDFGLLQLLKLVSPKAGESAAIISTLL